MRKISVAGLLYVLLLFSCSSSIGQYYENEYDVPYVPTSRGTVANMLLMANIRENDILYDLGCGDGRIVVTAAKEFGIRGVGIDIDPERIAESRDNAKKENVTDKVLFIEQNLFDADIHEATVVTLYLLPSINIKLRPKLFSDLRPGTRIVSHDFDMGKWEPDQEVHLDADFNDEEFFDNRTVYFWVLPANVTGTWELTVNESSGRKNVALQVEQVFQKASGTLVSGDFATVLRDFAVDGDRICFTVEEEAGGVTTTRTYKGIIEGDLITGTVAVQSGSSTATGDWTARRDPATKTSIHPVE